MPGDAFSWLTRGADMLCSFRWRMKPGKRRQQEVPRREGLDGDVETRDADLERQKPRDVLV